MKSTPNNPNNKKNDWQVPEPERRQVFLTPGAQKSLEEAQRKGEELKIKTSAPPKSNPTVQPPAIADSQNVRPQRSSKDQPLQKQTPQKTAVRNTPATKKPEPEGPLNLKDAVLAELRDRIRTIRMGIQVNSEDIIKGTICASLMMLFALLQTTFFARFAPFGKVPDLMLPFVVAIGVYEGEKWGSITGLVSAFVIQALGSSGIGPELLPLLYMPAGCMAGLLSKYYLRHTLPVNAIYMVVGALIKAVFTIITALFVLDASLSAIITKIAIPEYFSTLITAPVPFISVWLIFKRFHKTRAERTDSGTII